MKKSILILMLAVFLMSTGSLYAKNNNNNGKSSDRGNRSESSRNRGNKSEKVKNEKAVDAQKNWGKLKDSVDCADKYEEKEMKEEIKLKKRIRRAVRKNPDLDLSEEDIDQLIADYMAEGTTAETPETEATVAEDTAEAPVPVDEPVLDEDIEKALSKYKAAIERIEERRQEETAEDGDGIGEIPDGTGEVSEGTGEITETI